MLKFIQFVFEILIGILIVFFGIILAFIECNFQMGALIIAIGVFLCCVAIKNNPKNIDNSSLLKMSAGKRVFLSLVCLIATLIFFAVGITDTKETETENNSSTTSTTNTAIDSSQAQTSSHTINFGKCDISVKEHHKSKGFYDEDLLVVIYSFTNTSDSNINFSDSIEDKLFQNGVELDLYIATNIPGQVDIKDSYKELKPGASFDVPRAYKLNFNENSSIEINLSQKPNKGNTYTETIIIE